MQAPADERERSWPVIASLVVAAAVLRVPGLGRFPGVVADEGLWASSSKNFVAHGDWFMDGRTHGLLSPVFHALTVVSYALFGVSMSSARLVSAIAGCVSVALLFKLVERLTDDRRTATVAAVLMAVSAWFAFSQRQAMIESTQIVFLLAAAVLTARGDLRGAILGGLAMGLAVLTKLNVAYLCPVVALLMLPREAFTRSLLDRSTWVRLVAFSLATVLLAGGVNLLLYLAEPARFVSAYRFELEGAHFQRLSNPIFRVGRFGVDPVQIGRSTLELIRDAPFLSVLAVLGVCSRLLSPMRQHPALWLWLVWGTGFVFLQNFQPVRYFFLAAPMYCVFGAFAIRSLANDGGVIRGWPAPQVAAVVAYAVFNLAYLGMNSIANRDDRLPTVVTWMEENADPTDAVIAASYFAVDLPNPTYGHYYLGISDPDSLASSVARLGIDYIVFDDREWESDALQALEERYRLAEEWSFGAVFEVR